MERIHHISEIASWYIRQPNPDRKLRDGVAYKKGWEVRIVFDDFQKLELARGLLIEIGFKPGRPFRKRIQWVQPLYGQETVKRFLSVVGADSTISRCVCVFHLGGGIAWHLGFRLSCSQ